MEVIGTPEIQQALQQLGAEAVPALAAGMYRDAEGTMAISKEEFVPVDFGTLRGSGYVAPPVITGNTIEVELGYGGPAKDYALAVHENPRAGQTMGFSPHGKKYKHWAKVGQWKYLETPFKARVSGMIGRLETFLKERVRALG